MEGQNSTEEREGIFEKLAKKLEQTGNSAPEQPKINGLDTHGAVGALTGQNNVEKEERPRPISGANLFTVFEMNRKRKTAVIEVQKEAAMPTCLKPEPKITDFNWNEPFNIYGRILRKDGAGFGDENVTAHFTKIYSIQSDLEDLAAKAEEIKQVIQEGSETAIETDYANKKISEIEKRCTLAKLSEKREAFLHYTGICYLGLWMAGHSKSLQNGKQPSENGDCQSVHGTYNLVMEMAKSSFIKHNRDPARPKDGDSTKEEDSESRDSVKNEDLEKMCSEDDLAHDIFQKTIVELAGLFAKQFSAMSPTSIRLYHNMLHSNNMKDLLVSLGSPSLTTPLLQIEYLSKL